ncbi:MAG TPA: NUDIX domain-containing protein [Dongiaceae bacterium]|nr:NUDIX domain-containing protein [Dongiaceae bacterium]
MMKGIEILAKSELYAGFFRLALYRFRHRLFAGGWSAEIQRELCERPHAVGVLPYDPAADKVVLIEQFRIGAWAAGLEAWQTEIVAGFVEEGEAEAEVAHREAREEASLELSALLPICRYAVSPGGSSESVSLYCGRVDSRGAGGIHGLPEEHEDIRVEVLSFADAMRRLDEGAITNATSIIALQWLALNRDRVRAAWR